MKRKRIGFILTALLLFGTLVTAGWIIYHESTPAELEIISPQPIIFHEINWDLGSVDTTYNSSTSDTIELMVQNVNSEKTLSHSILETVNYTDSGCTNGTNDCTMYCSWDGSPITCEANVQSGADMNQSYEFYTTCVQNSCGAIRQYTITVTEA